MMVSTPRFSFLGGLIGVLAIRAAPASSRAQSDWPQWRGPDREGVAPASNGELLRSWPENGPPVVWQVDTVGNGYASMAVSDGRLYTQGDLDGIEHIIAISTRDGSTVWAVQPAPAAARLQQRVDAEFERADENNDLVISETEALRHLGWRFNEFDRPADGDREAIAQARLERFLAEVDENGDGVLTFSEAGLLQDGFGRIDSAEPGADVDALAASRAAAIFEEYDRDENGVLTRDESRGSALQRSFGRADTREADTGRGDGTLSREEVTTYFRRQQAGRDGRLTREELLRFYSRQQPGCDGRLTRAELRSFHGGYRNGMGHGPRGTPTVHRGKIYTVGGQGDVTCLDAESGKTLWHVHMVSDLGGRVPNWGYSESPLVQENLVIVTPGGSQGTLAALDTETGSVVWRSSGTTQRAGYSSAVAATIGGIRQIVQFAGESVFGARADDGTVLWTYARPANSTANCSTPIVHQNHVFAASAYDTGGGMVRIVTEGQEQRAEEVYFESRMTNHHGGLVRIGDYLYGFGSGGLACLDFASGEIQWRAGSVRKGSLIAAGDQLYLWGERYELALAEANPEEYREHGRVTLPSHGRPSWAHPIIAGGRLYVRDQASLTCFDLRTDE